MRDKLICPCLTPHNHLQLCDSKFRARQIELHWAWLKQNKKKILEALSYFFYGPLKHYVNTQSKSPVSFLAEQLKSWFPGKGSSLLWNHFWKMPQKQARLKLSLCVSTGQKNPHSLHCNIFHQMNKWKTSDFCSVTSTFRFLFRKKWKKSGKCKQNTISLNLSSSRFQFFISSKHYSIH